MGSSGDETEEMTKLVGSETGLKGFLSYGKESHGKWKETGSREQMERIKERSIGKP